MSIEHYNLLKKLGSGSAGVVYLAESQNKHFAVKLCAKGSEGESRIQPSLNHPNILKVVDVFPQARLQGALPKSKPARKENICFAVVSELAMENKDLLNVVQKHKRLSDKVTRSCFHQLIQAVEYLHSEGYCHLDIKPENILFSKSGLLKLADFGFATQWQEAKFESKKGTSSYMAPQVHRCLYDGKEADLYSVGIVLFVMLTGHMPFLAADFSSRHFKLLVCGQPEKFWQVHQAELAEGSIDPDFKDLIEKMLAFSPSDRLTISDIKSHRWYQGQTLTPEALKAHLLE